MNPYKIDVEGIEGRPGIYFGEFSSQKMYWCMKGYHYWLTRLFGNAPVYLPGFQEYINKMMLQGLNSQKNWGEACRLYSRSDEESFKVYLKKKNQFLDSLKTDEDSLYNEWHPSTTDKGIILDYEKLYGDFRRSPKMFFVRKSFFRMMEFSYGCSLCNATYSAKKITMNVPTSNIVNDICSFRDFLFEYYNLSGFHDFNWPRMLEFLCDSDEEAFDTFFMLYDLYREKYPAMEV